MSHDHDGTAEAVIAGIYIALCSALNDEGARHVNNTLLEFANDPRTPKDEARAYRMIAESAARNIERPPARYGWLGAEQLSTRLH